MGAAQIDHQLIRDEYPHVVVTGKRKDLSPAVNERGVRLQGEVIVAWEAFVAEQLVVDRKDRAILEEVAARRVRTSYQLQPAVLVHVYARHTVIPRIKPPLPRRPAGR